MITVKTYTTGATGYTLMLNGKAMSQVEILNSGYRYTQADLDTVAKAAEDNKSVEWVGYELRKLVDRLGVINMRDIISYKVELTDDEKEGLVQLLCKRCRSQKWNRIRSILKYDMLGLDTAGIMERVEFDIVRGRWTYTAGQDYTSEIAYIRDNLVYSA